MWQDYFERFIKDKMGWKTVKLKQNRLTVYLIAIAIIVGIGITVYMVIFAFKAQEGIFTDIPEGYTMTANLINTSKNTILSRL